VGDICTACEGLDLIGSGKRAESKMTEQVQQSADAVLMIRPYRFYPNPETAADNAFQQDTTDDIAAVSAAAQREFDEAVATLRTAGVAVHVIHDTAAPEKPDAVFPNNWISTHHDGRIALYPMYSAVRRRERRQDVIGELKKSYRVTEVIDYSDCEEHGQPLEGTGSLVLDHVNKTAYVSLSKRAHPKPLERFCDDFGYKPVTFTSVGADGRPIYHTNVMMCVGSAFALVGLGMIPDERERSRVRDRLAASGKEIIELDRDQIANFAGNTIELHNLDSKLLVLSRRALSALSEEQRAKVEQHAQLVSLSLPTIELGGGSARCMIATIHLPLL
jgi:hypothetical protein